MLNRSGQILSLDLRDASERPDLFPCRRVSRAERAVANRPAASAPASCVTVSLLHSCFADRLGNSGDSKSAASGTQSHAGLPHLTQTTPQLHADEPLSPALVRQMADQKRENMGEALRAQDAEHAALVDRGVLPKVHGHGKHE